MLDDASLTAVVRGHVGHDARFSKYDSAVHSPMGIAISVAEQILGRPVAVFGVDGGLPQIFALPKLRPAVVVYNTNYLEFVVQVRDTVWARLDDTLMENAAEHVSLRVIAQLMLRYGDPGVACELFMASRLVSNVTAAPVKAVQEMDFADLDETYAATWFYPLMHELGHVYDLDHRPAGVSTERDVLARLIALVMLPDPDGADPDAAAKAANAAEAADPALRQAIQEIVDSPRAEVLVSELAADAISVHLLFSATAAVMHANGTLDVFSPLRLAAQTLQMFDFYHYLNSCAAAAQGEPVLGTSDDRFGSWRRIVHTVRTVAILDAVALAVAYGPNQPDQPDLTVLEANRDLLIRFTAGQAASLAAFDRGHTRALRAALDPAERRPDIRAEFAATIEHNLLAAALSIGEAREFLALAESLDVRHPDLVLLSAIIADPFHAGQIVRDSGGAGT